MAFVYNSKCITTLSGSFLFTIYLDTFLIFHNLLYAIRTHYKNSNEFVCEFFNLVIYNISSFFKHRTQNLTIHYFNFFTIYFLINGHSNA